MKCPVCAAEFRDATLCPACGFDPAQDYEAYPSLAPLAGGKPLSALRAAWQERNRDLLRCPDCGGMRFQFDMTKQVFLCCSCGVRFSLQAAPEQTPVAPAEEPASDFSALRWRLEENGRLFISGQGAMDDHIPWAAKSASIRFVGVKPGVRSIAPHAFAGCAWLTGVYLPTSLRSIGNGAFRSCTRLKSITLPEGVEEIGEDAFRYCGNLESISLPASLKRMAANALEGCDSLETILFSGSSAQWSALGGKEALKGSRAKVICALKSEEEALPLQYDSPAEEPASDFSALRWTLEEDGSLFISGQGDMDDLIPWAAKSASIRFVRVEAGVRSIASHAFASCARLTEVYLPTSLRRIGNGAFRSCTRLEKIALPEGVEEIGAGAFRYCGNLKSISLPASLKRVGVDALQGCDSLESILFSGSNVQWSGIGGKEALEGTRARVICELGDEEEEAELLTWQYYPTEKTLILYSVKQIPDYSHEKAPWHKLRSSVKRIVLREGLEQIGANAFSGMSALESVSFPNSLRRIDKNAFEYCEKLQELALPEHLEFIGDYAFQSCTSLKKLDLPETLSSLGSRAFQYCYGLRELSLHPISDLGVSPFYCCENLASVSFHGNRSQWERMSLPDMKNAHVEVLSDPE